MDQTYKRSEVILKFYLPDNEDELLDALRGSKYSSALSEIYHHCRNVWKYEENASEEKINFAEEIASIVTETGCME